MGVGRRDQRRGIGQMKMLSNGLAHLPPDVAQDALPFVVDGGGRIAPALQLRVARHVWPEAMAVRGEIEPLARRSTEAREGRAQVERNSLGHRCRIHEGWPTPCWRGSRAKGSRNL